MTKMLIFYKAFIKADMHYCELMGQGLILTSRIHFLIMVLSGFSQDMNVKNPRLYAVLTLVMLNKLRCHTHFKL